MPPRLHLLVPPLLALVACSKDQVQVSAGGTNYNQVELGAAVDTYVEQERSPEAFAELSQRVLALRNGMDRTVAKDAELKLMTLALAPVQAVQALPMAAQVDQLALTVWPTLLSEPIIADGVLLKRNPKPELAPRPQESATGYLTRLCGGPLASECKQIVPEFQGAIVSAFATRRAMERARNAVGECVMCGADPGWGEAVGAWEALDRMASASTHDVERRAHPANWPTAGAAAQARETLEDATALWREAEINAVGEVVVGGQRYAGNLRIDALRDLRAGSESISLHLRPELSLAQVKGVLADAHKAGARRVAIVARTPSYPWERRVYWLSDQGKQRVGLRPTDSLQLLLHTLDHVASPGVVARVD